MKGVEFGAGFGAAEMTGSLHNDPFILKDGEIRKEFERSETLTESELIREMV